MSLIAFNFAADKGINLSQVTKHNQVTIKLKTNTGANILWKDKPTARNIVNSESFDNLSNVKRDPNNKPTGKALPKILGNS